MFSDTAIFAARDGKLSGDVGWILEALAENLCYFITVASGPPIR